jgi:hypothetical protein
VRVPLERLQESAGRSGLVIRRITQAEDSVTQRNGSWSTSNHFAQRHATWAWFSTSSVLPQPAALLPAAAAPTGRAAKGRAWPSCTPEGHAGPDTVSGASSVATAGIAGPFL